YGERLDQRVQHRQRGRELIGRSTVEGGGTLVQIILELRGEGVVVEIGWDFRREKRCIQWENGADVSRAVRADALEGIDELIRGEGRDILSENRDVADALQRGCIQEVNLPANDLRGGLGGNKGQAVGITVHIDRRERTEIGALRQQGLQVGKLLIDALVS